MSDTNNKSFTNNNIEKFEGSFSSEQSGCTIIINDTINSIQNGDGLALYIYLACRPNNWRLNIKNLMTHFGWGRDKTYNALTYLQKVNLLEHQELRQSGKFIRHDYFLRLKGFLPLPENQEVVGNQRQSRSSPLPDKPEAVKPDPVNQETYKTKNIENKENITTTSSSINFVQECITEPPPEIPLISETNLFKDYKQKETESLALVNEEHAKQAMREKFKRESLTDSQCNEEYQRRFKGIPVTLESLYEECADYWSQKNQMVYKSRFLSHLKRTPLDKYKASEDLKTKTALTPDERNLVQTCVSLRKAGREPSTEQINHLLILKRRLKATDTPEAREALNNLEKAEEIKASKNFESLVAKAKQKTVLSDTARTSLQACKAALQ